MRVAASNSAQHEYNAQNIPVNSYYLLHGKFNGGKGSKKSSSVKATDLMSGG